MGTETELSQQEINIMINESIKMMDDSEKYYQGFNSRYRTRQGIRVIIINGKVVYSSRG